MGQVGDQITKGNTGEAIDQNMLAPDLLPHPPQTSQAKQV